MDPYDVISGAAGVGMIGWLTDDSPTVLPVQLRTIVQASFAGYAPAGLIIATQGATSNGCAIASGDLSFCNNAGNARVTATALVIVTDTNPPLLLQYIPLQGGDLDPLPAGVFTVTVSLFAMDGTGD